MQDNSKQTSNIQTISNIRKVLLISMISCLGISTFLCIIWILSSSGGSLIGQFASTMGILGLLSLFSFNNLGRIINNRRSVRITSIIALVSNFVWSLTWLILVWGIYEVIFGSCPSHSYCSRATEDTWKVAIIFITISCVMTLTSNYLNFKISSPTTKFLELLTISMASMLSFFIIFGFVLELLPSTPFQFILIIITLLVFGMIITPVLAKAEQAKKHVTPQPAPTIDNMTKSSVPQPSNINQRSEQQIRAELERELRSKIEQEVRSELEQTLRTELKQELRAEIEQEIRAELSNKQLD